jgi:hypothetical protein
MNLKEINGQVTNEIHDFFFFGWIGLEFALLSFITYYELVNLDILFSAEVMYWNRLNNSIEYH